MISPLLCPTRPPESVSPLRAKADPGLCHCPEVLFAACELGVFELLAAAPEPLDSAAVSARLGASPRGTELLLDACVSLKLLQAGVSGGKGKRPGSSEEGVFRAHPQRCSAFFVVVAAFLQRARVSLLGLVGRPRGLCR